MSVSGIRMQLVGEERVCRTAEEFHEPPDVRPIFRAGNTDLEPSSPATMSWARPGRERAPPGPTALVSEVFNRRHLNTSVKTAGRRRRSHRTACLRPYSLRLQVPEVPGCGVARAACDDVRRSSTTAG